MLDNKEDNLEKIVNTADETNTEVSIVDEKEEINEVGVDETKDLIEVNNKVSIDAGEEVKEVVDETTDAVEEIEKTVAEEAEREQSKEELSLIDFTKLSLEDLVSELDKTIANNPVQKIKSTIDAIKNAFNQQFGTLLSEKKEAFLAEGGNAIDFQFSSPIKADYNKLLSDYKKQRDTHYGNLEKQLKDNLGKRQVVIEDLKNLIQNADSATMYKKFKEIQDAWRAIGPVSKTRYNDTWKTYHHHVERFYDLLNLSNDFRDLDFKHNLEEKLTIVTKAEALVEETDINKAFKELQDLHKIWKEDIGPVSQERREEIWQRFSAATKKIHDKRHNHFREMRSKYQEIIDKKLVIVSEINAYDTSSNQSHKDWQQSIKDIEALRQQYFNVGKLPYSKSEEIWQQFKVATKKFNSEKNVFYKQEKGDQQENLKKKIALIEIAESLKESEDWEQATNTMKKVQSDWKKIGHVPRKFSDDIWKRFKAACNLYFDRYHQQKNAISQEQQNIVDAKKSFLETLKLELTPTKDLILSAISNWRELGQLPRNMRHLEGKFNKQIDKMLESLSMDKKEVSMLKFVNLIDGLAADNDVRKLDSEQLFVRKKIDESVKEIQQLENNLGFFSNAKADNPLVLNVRNKIDNFKEDLDIWKVKLSYIKKLDY